MWMHATHIRQRAINLLIITLVPDVSGYGSHLADCDFVCTTWSSSQSKPQDLHTHGSTCFLKLGNPQSFVCIDQLVLTTNKAPVHKGSLCRSIISALRGSLSLMVSREQADESYGLIDGMERAQSNRWTNGHMFQRHKTPLRSSQLIYLYNSSSLSSFFVHCVP